MRSKARVEGNPPADHVYVLHPEVLFAFIIASIMLFCILARAVHALGA